MNPEQQTQLLENLARLVQLMEQNQQASHTSPAAQVILATVPVVSIVFGTALLFFFFMWNYKLRKELIRTGQYKQTKIENLRLFSLLLGILSTAVGLPMTVLFLAIEGISYVVLGGVIPLFTGIGLLVFYATSRTSETTGPAAE